MVHEHMSRKTEGKTSRELLQLLRVTVYLLCTMIFAIGYIVTFYRLERYSHATVLACRRPLSKRSLTSLCIDT